MPRRPQHRPRRHSRPQTTTPGFHRRRQDALHVRLGENGSGTAAMLNPSADFCTAQGAGVWND
ncbi:hypothetical protein ACU686_13100 [Yinghuangia aomiensis]